jgi:type I restriction enzyme M protein
VFIDGRKLGALIPGSGKQKRLADDEIEKMAAVYRQFRRQGVPDEVPGFCRVAKLDEVREHNYALTSGRYVGSADNDDGEEEFEEKMPSLISALEDQFAESAKLETEIRTNLREVGLVA